MKKKNGKTVAFGYNELLQNSKTAIFSKLKIFRDMDMPNFHEKISRKTQAKSVFVTTKGKLRLLKPDKER